MKKTAGLMLALLLLLTAAGCGKQTAPGNKTTETIPVLLSQEEYVLYQNVFYNDFGRQLEGTRVTKRGVLATLQDAFNRRTRYYVWGYMDNTKCCDWQWEFVPEDPAALPPDGSLISVRGSFAASEEALDGYWIEKASFEVEAAYAGDRAELNMQAMSCTLERVQMYNILARPDSFQGKKFNAYGRVAGPNTLEDPYYNGSWQIAFSSKDPAPAIGTQIILNGTVGYGALADCAVKTAD